MTVALCVKNKKCEWGQFGDAVGANGTDSAKNLQGHPAGTLNLVQPCPTQIWWIYTFNLTTEHSSVSVLNCCEVFWCLSVRLLTELVNQWVVKKVGEVCLCVSVCRCVNKSAEWFHFEKKSVNLWSWSDEAMSQQCILTGLLQSDHRKRENSWLISGSQTFSGLFRSQKNNISPALIQYIFVSH